MNNNAYVSEYGEISNKILLNVAEILTLRMPEGADRIIAAKWVKKFLACNSNDYKNYLSLFICALTKQMLVEPFDKVPQDPREVWHRFEKDYTPADINVAIRSRMNRDALTPSYQIEISQDQQEYIAFQEISYFGAHFYYAFSPTEKINHWKMFSKLKVPKKYIDAMLIADITESPMKGRISRKPYDHGLKKDQLSKQPTKISVSATPSASTPICQAQTSQTTEKLTSPSRINRPGRKHNSSKTCKPKWEGPLEESDEGSANEKSPRKTMVTIPTDHPVKAIPPALQRRMAEAERQKQESLANKKKEMMETNENSRSAIPGRKTKLSLDVPTSRKSIAGNASPSSSSVKATSFSLRKKALMNNRKKLSLTDDVDSALLATDPPQGELEQSTARKPDVPIFHGPKNKMELYREIIAERMREIREMELSANISTQQDGTSNEPVNNEILDKEISQVNESQAAELNVIMNKANIVDEEFGDLVLNLSILNDSTFKPVVASDTIRRLNEIKARAEGMALIPALLQTRQLLTPDNDPRREFITENAEDLIDLIGSTVERASDAIANLSQVHSNTVEEKIAVDKLITSNKNLISNVSGKNLELVQPLIDAIDSNDPDLALIVVNLAENLNNSIEMIHENDEDLVGNFVGTPAVQEAVDIQDLRDEHLESVTVEADKLSERVKAITSMFDGKYKAQDPAVRRFLGQDDIEDDLIDIHENGLDFEGGFITEEEFKAQENVANKQLRAELIAEQNKLMEKQSSITSQMFDAIAGETENLDDLTEDFEALLDESIDELDQLVIELDRSMENDGNQQQVDVIQNIISHVEETRQYLQTSKDLPESTNDSKSVLNFDDSTPVLKSTHRPLIQVLSGENIDVSEDQPHSPLILFSSSDEQC